MENEALYCLEDFGFLSEIVCCLIIAITVIVVALIIIRYMKNRHKQELEMEKNIIQVENIKSVNALLLEIKQELKSIRDMLAEVRSERH